MYVYECVCVILCYIQATTKISKKEISLSIRPQTVLIVSKKNLSKD